MMWPCGTISQLHGALDKFSSAYMKCIKVFLDTLNLSVSAMLTELNLYKFDSLVVDKCRSDFQRQIHAYGNSIVQHFVCLHLM